MMLFTKKISKNYALDILAFVPIRSPRDGLTVQEFVVNADWYRGDHNPKLTVRLVLLNITIIDIAIYNVHHIEEET